MSYNPNDPKNTSSANSNRKSDSNSQYTPNQNYRSPYSGSTQNPKFTEQIQENLRKKGSSQEFTLNIADESFYQIPDVEHSQKRTSSVKNSPSTPTSNRRPPNSSSSSSRSPQRKTSAKKGKKSKGIFGSLLYVLAVVGASIFLSVFLLQSMNDYLGLLKKGDITTVTIPENPTSYQVAKILKDNKIISQPFTFSLYYNWKGIGDKFSGGGEYNLDPKSAYDEIFSVLTDSSDENSIVKITIPEGRTIRETAALLEENNICDAKDFINALNDAFERKAYPWMEQIPNPTTNERYMALEGYIFPNTHTMTKGENPDSVAKRFLDDFTTQLTLFEDEMNKRGMTLDELITLASLIERECSGHTDQMYRVSAVFHNRLAEGSPYPLLQSDVTINYVEWDIKPYLDQQSDAEAYAAVYNTYKVEGLPAGPISNPGMNAIQAALYPDDQYPGEYFFVTDANDEFYYAKTYEEHQKNVKTAAAVKDANGEATVGGVATE